jgi:hypothetical protein
MADVNLVDLEVIKRYSLAIRQESAPADEVLAVLDLSREAVLAAMASGSRTRKAAAPRKAPAKATAARRAPAKKAARGAATKKATRTASATRRRSR